MPLTTYICPDNGRISIADCLKEGNCRMKSRCASRSYLRLVARERKWRGKPSTTQLIKGTMEAFLLLTKDYAITPDSRAFMLHGTKGHAILEGSDDEHSTLEYAFNRYQCRACGHEFDLEYAKKDEYKCPNCNSEDIENTQEITGMSDFLEKECNILTLGDYKTAGSYKVAKVLGFFVDEEKTEEVYKSGKRKGEHKMRKVLKRDPSKEDRWEWELQENKYRMEFEKRLGRLIDKLKVQCCVRDGNTYIARSRGVFRNVYYFEITRLDDTYVIDYFRRKKEALLQALKQGYWDEPCNKKENWDGVKCSAYCPVADYCKLGKYLKKDKEVEDMAIKGLSEVRRLPRVGKIRLGIKKNKDGVEYPAEVDYFILDPQTPSELENKRLKDIFHHKYGEQPKQIPVMLPVGDIDIVFPQFYKRYGKTTMLQCKGDGVEAVCTTDEFTEGLEEIGKTDMGLPKVKCLGPHCPYQKNRQCGRVGTLQVLLPELPGSGVWQITTGSYNSIVNINSCLDYVKTVAGRFNMIPVILERREQLIQNEGKARKHYIMHINLNVSLADLQKYASIDSTKIMLELPAPEESKEDILFQINEIIDSEPVEETSAPKEAAPGTDKIDEATKRKIIAMGIAKKWNEETIKNYIKEIYDLAKIEDLNKDQANTVFNYIKNI